MPPVVTALGTGTFLAAMYRLRVVASKPKSLAASRVEKVLICYGVADSLEEVNCPFSNVSNVSNALQYSSVLSVLRRDVFRGLTGRLTGCSFARPSSVIWLTMNPRLKTSARLLPGCELRPVRTSWCPLGVHDYRDLERHAGARRT